MRALSSILLCVASLVAFADANDAVQHPLLLHSVAVIDGQGTAPQPMRDMLIVDGRIAKTSVAGQIGALPTATQTIDGRGLTALPGLIDLHVHLGDVDFGAVTDNAESRAFQKGLNAYLYAGVTTVQDLGNDHNQIIALRDEIASGERLGPTIYAVGASIERLQTVSSAFDLTSTDTQAEIRSLLDEREAAGIRTIKLYAGVSNWSARHIVHAAKQRDMRVVADFWCTNLSRTAFEVTGIDGFAHGGCRAVTNEEAEWMAANGKFAMITLSLFDVMGGHRAYADFEERSFLKDPLIVNPLGKAHLQDYYEHFAQIREEYEDGERSLYATQLFGDLKNLVQENLQSVKTLYDADVLIGLGTDSSFPPGNWPGESMHYELAMHVKAGISPVHAIQMATLNGARILRIDNEVGTLEPGKRADIIVVRGDPSTDIDRTRDIVHVIKGGKLLDRKALRSG